MDQDQGPLPKEWFCNVCLGKRPALFAEHDGSFALLLERLDRKNPSAFRLPGDVRDYFEGVKTGPDGEYEEAVAAAKQSRKRKNEEQEAPDFTKLRDAENNAVLCHQCQLSSDDRRTIIPCSLCGLYWHLDCLEPPMTHPPVLRTWRCPAHVDDLLSRLPGTLGPAHKFRKIKGAPVIQPAFSMGNVNNGFIDVVLDETAEQGGWRDVRTFGKLYQLHERGIELDFLSRVSRDRRKRSAASRALLAAQTSPVPLAAQSSPAPLAAQANAAPTPSTPAPASSLPPRTVDEQQSALSLAQLVDATEPEMKRLIDAMLMQADPVSLAIMGKSSAVNLRDENLNAMDTQALRTMLAQIEFLKTRIGETLTRRDDDKTPQNTQSVVSSPHAPSAASPAAVHEQAQEHEDEQEQEQEQEQETMVDESNTSMEDPGRTETAKKDLPPSPAATDDAATTESQKDGGEEKTMTDTGMGPQEETQDPLLASGAPEEVKPEVDVAAPVPPADIEEEPAAAQDDELAIKEESLPREELLAEQPVAEKDPAAPAESHVLEAPEAVKSEDPMAMDLD